MQGKAPELLYVSGFLTSANTYEVYNSFGEYDGLIIFEAPDEGTAAATLMAAIKPGHLKSLKTTQLLSAEEGVEAMRRAGEATYRRPGQ